MARQQRGAVAKAIERELWESVRALALVGMRVQSVTLPWLEFQEIADTYGLAAPDSMRWNRPPHDVLVYRGSV